MIAALVEMPESRNEPFWEAVTKIWQCKSTCLLTQRRILSKSCQKTTKYTFNNMQICHSRYRNWLYILQYRWRHICFLSVYYFLELIDYGQTGKNTGVFSAASLFWYLLLVPIRAERLALNGYCTLSLTSKILCKLLVLTLTWYGLG